MALAWKIGCIAFWYLGQGGPSRSQNYVAVWMCFWKRPKRVKMIWTTINVFSKVLVQQQEVGPLHAFSLWSNFWNIFEVDPKWKLYSFGTPDISRHLFSHMTYIWQELECLAELPIHLFLPSFLLKTQIGSIDFYIKMSLEMWCFPGLLRSLLWPLLHLASLPILRFGARCWSQRHGHVPRVHGCHQRRRCLGRSYGSWEQLPDGYFVFFLGWYKGASMTMRITAQGCETKNFELIKSE